MTPINLYDCAPACDITKVVKVGRATWLCAKCRTDVNMRYLFWYEAMREGKV